MNKLQPDRTIALRGFDSFAAAACIHSATPNSFKVSGTFRDPADFAVAVLYDADNFYEHPRIKHLPDFDFSGLTLTFDLQYSNGLQPIDSPKYNWIDWATLDCLPPHGEPKKITLWDYATLQSGSFTSARTTCTLSGPVTGLKPYDQATLWYQNLAFDHIVKPGTNTCTFDFFATTSVTQSIVVNGVTYPYTQTDPAGESSAQVARGVAAAVNDANVTAQVTGQGYSVTVTVRPQASDKDIVVSATGYGNTLLRLSTPKFAAADMASQINGTNWLSAGAPYALIADANGAAITVTAGRYGSVAVSGPTVRWLSKDDIAPFLAANQTAVAGPRFAGISAGSRVWIAGQPFTVVSVDSFTQLTLDSSPGDSPNAQFVAERGGVDGNLITLVGLAGAASTLQFDSTEYQMGGGASSCTWRISIDFTALGIDTLRQCWFTFAPSLVTGPYPATDWEATFTNWTLSGDPAKCALTFAGPGSVRIEESDSACSYSTSIVQSKPVEDWVTVTPASGFYSKHFAKASKVSGAMITVSWTCQYVHDLYLGTALYGDYGSVDVSVDGGLPSTVDCTVTHAGSPVVSRRRSHTNLAAGKHTATIRLKSADYFLFDFLEAAVVSDAPDALAARDTISPALDFDTDHTYKLPPARVMWMFDKLGYAGPMNEYLGVFWWNQRVRPGASYSTVTVDFSGTFSNEGITFSLNDTGIGKTTFPADDTASIARHFAYLINGAFVGARAEVSGSRLTVIARSPSSVYDVILKQTAAYKGQVLPDPRVTVHVVQANGQDSDWLVDDTQPQPLNRAMRDWHADFYAQCAARKREVVTACSMELVLPPPGYAAKYPDGTEVVTGTLFGNLTSKHCALGGSKMLPFQKSVYREIVELQTAAGLKPWVQFGEFLWWFFEAVHRVGGGMAFYDDDTKAAARASLGRDLWEFQAQDDDPAAHPDDAVFLRNRLRDHIAALAAEVRATNPATRCEVLFPYDVNYPERLPDSDLGGRLLRFVNLPVEWQLRQTSGLDFMKTEALQFATSFRNLNLAREAIELFPNFGWPVDSVRYLVPIFGTPVPWHRELALARGAGLRENNLWAFDHVCLFNLDVPERALERRSVVKAA